MSPARGPLIGTSAEAKVTDIQERLRALSRDGSLGPILTQRLAAYLGRPVRCSSGETTASLLATVREGGVIVTIAGAAPEEAASARGVRAELLIMSPDAGQLAHVAELVASGEVRVEIAETLPLADAARAHELSESGHTRGKIILIAGD